MIKVIGNNAWKGTLWDEDNPRVAVIKYASNGLSGMDKQAFVKRAASEETSEELLKKVAKMEVKPGEELIHLIAMGSTEAYGPNRNGDGFSKKACIQYHPTFVKHAHFYRNHKNKDPKKSYGIVKASAYNPVMQRVELVVALNGNEKAAKANDGLVATKEMEKLASGEDIAVSMACLTNPDYPILTKDGYKPIKDITAGMEVIAKDGELHKVTGINRRVYTGVICTVEWDGCEKPLEITGDHLLWVAQEYTWSWIHAHKLKVGFHLLHYNEKARKFDKSCEITKLTFQKAENVQTYNFEVEDDPSYIAGGIVSHNCSVPFDVCSCCGNKATKREEYCKSPDEGGKCEAGGLFKNIGKMASVGGKLKQLYADNTQPDFFDISNVFVPADRIAYSSGLVKHASADSVPFSEKDAEWEFAYDPEAPTELATLQETIMSYQADGEKRASSVGWTDTKPLTNTHIPNSYIPGNAYKALHDCGICLPAANFIQLTQRCSFDKAASLAKVIAPLSNSCLMAMSGSDTRNNPYLGSKGAPDVLYKWAMNQRLTPTNVKSWVKQAALNSFEEDHNKITVEEINKIKHDEWIKRAAWNYGLYKLAFLQSQPEEDKEDLAYLLVSRDYYPCVF